MSVGSNPELLFTVGMKRDEERLTASERKAREGSMKTKYRKASVDRLRSSNCDKDTIDGLPS